MADQFIGEIRIFAGSFAPQDWLFCAGQLLSINDYETLFSLIGTTYGGDGQSTFQLPDLRSRVPVHVGTLSGGQSYAIGQTGGVEAVTLLASQVASHSHPVAATGTSPATSPASALFAVAGATSLQVSTYSTASPTTALAGGSVQPTPSGAHDNRQASVAINFIIATQGIYPSSS